jgi:hypothetical protein
MMVEPSGRFAVCGREDGSVVLYELNETLNARTLYQPTPPCPVRLLTLGHDSIIAVDDTNMLIVFRPIKGSETEDWGFVYRVIHPPIVDNMEVVVRIHVHRTMPKLVVSKRHVDFLWNIDTPGQEMALVAARPGIRTWIDHPQDSDCMICFDGIHACIVSCHDWSRLACVDIPTRSGFVRPTLYVKQVLPYSYRLLFEFCEEDKPDGTSDVVIVNMSVFELP